MIKNFIFICTIIFGLATISCKNSNQEKEVPTVKVADSSAVKSNNDSQTANTPAQIFAKPEVPVLCYHRISDGNKGDYTVSPECFNNHIKVLFDSGYQTISPTQLYDYLVFNKQLPPKPVLITFDDSRIEHFENAALTLEKYGFRGVFFIMTITYNKKNYMTTEQIAALLKCGHTIGLHSWDHTMVTKYKEEKDWNTQVVESRKKLETIIGGPVDFWAYPNGVYNHESAEKMSQYFKLSFSLATKRDSLQPLQCIRRIIVPECSPQGLLRSMNQSFNKTK